jgi:hypothetical protein
MLEPEFEIMTQTSYMQGISEIDEILLSVQAGNQ